VTPVTEQDRRDYAFLLENAEVARERQVPFALHLDQPVNLWNYIRIANDIARQVPAGTLLDWGCGYGQMTYLLRQRGFQVTAYDVGEPDARLPDLPLCRDLDVIRTAHPTALPFADGQFDAVLSCGVLEHVDEFSQPGNERLSLQEIRRVLKPGGAFLIYQLPQRHAWQEAVIRRFRLGYAHPRRFTADEIRHMLNAAGYDVQRLRRANLIPKNLTGMPPRVRQLYRRAGRAFIVLDGWLSNLPLLSHLAGVLEVTARVSTDDRQPG
jgi:SAM-dependent methyltransferase